VAVLDVAVGVAYRRWGGGGGRGRNGGCGAAATAIAVRGVVCVSVPVTGLEAVPRWITRNCRRFDVSGHSHDPADQEADGEKRADGSLEGIPPNNGHTTLLSM